MWRLYSRFGLCNPLIAWDHIYRNRKWTRMIVLCLHWKYRVSNLFALHQYRNSHHDFSLLLSPTDVKTVWYPSNRNGFPPHTLLFTVNILVSSSRMFHPVAMGNLWDGQIIFARTQEIQNLTISSLFDENITFVVGCKEEPYFFNSLKPGRE